MKSKKIISLALALIMAFAMFVVAVPTASAVTNEVSLIYAKSGWSIGGHTYGYIHNYGYVEVENLGYNKSVTIHYSINGRTWEDLAATYVGPTHGNKEAWYFDLFVSEINYGLPATTVFAVKYQVNGQTYWDNNNGNNYSIFTGTYYGVKPLMAFGSGAVAVDYYYQDHDSTGSYTNGFYGYLTLKNIAYQKNVKIRYSTDNWASYTEFSASYNSSNNGDNTEQWYFERSQLPSDWETLEFAASYTVNGVTYWDNNFGSNYVIERKY